MGDWATNPNRSNTNFSIYRQSRVNGKSDWIIGWKRTTRRSTSKWQQNIVENLQYNCNVEFLKRYMKAKH